MNRLDLLRSPIFLLSLAVLVANDLVLKVAYHNWLTGKLSDFAGLAAFTIFLCSIWKARRWAVAVIVTVAFAYWKSPYSQGLIDSANGVLPFQIGRTVDYSDLLALPVVWVCCAYARRMPLLPMREFQVWCIAGISLAAFTGTSQAPRYESVRETAALGPMGRPASSSATEADIQQLLDSLAQAHGMRCTICDPLSRGRVYSNDANDANDGNDANSGQRSLNSLSLFASYDARDAVLLYQIGRRIDIGSEEKHGALLRTELVRSLRARYPMVNVHAAGDPAVTAEVEFDVISKNERPQSEGAAAQDDYRAALDIVGRIAAGSGLQKIGEYHFADGRLLSRDVRELVVTVHPAGPRISIACYSEACRGRVQPLALTIESGLKEKFGENRVSRR